MIEVVFKNPTGLEILNKKEIGKVMAPLTLILSLQGRGVIVVAHQGYAMVSMKYGRCLDGRC